MRARPLTLIFAGALALACVSQIAIAANPPSPPGGGGPSMSVPAYDPTADYQAGLKALQAGQYKDADRYFNKVLNADSRNASVLMLLGMSKMGANDIKGAQRAYERAVRADSRNIDAKRELAMVLIKQGDAKAAGDQLKAMQTQNTRCKNTCPEAAKIAGAIAAVEAAMAAKPTAALAPSMIFTSAKAGDTAYLTAIGLVNTGRYEEAITAFRTAEQAFGPHPDVLTYLGFSHRKLGLYDEAERYYRTALRVAPDHKGATEYYGELKIERGDLAGAKQMLARLGEICAFGCAEEQELRRWVDAAERS